MRALALPMQLRMRLMSDLRFRLLPLLGLGTLLVPSVALAQPAPPEIVAPPAPPPPGAPRGGARGRGGGGGRLRRA